MSESPQNNEGKDFNPADGEGDQTGGVSTSPEATHTIPDPSEEESSQERTERLLPSSGTGDEGGSQFESDPN